ncbi:putative hemagglutinin [unidentified eubacterium SCB49]|nr:putative hemagglutinin [unidentified eubacterium SCB49]
MNIKLKYSGFILLFLVGFVGCKSKKKVVYKERAPRVVIDNSKEKPVVATTTPTKPSGGSTDVVSNYINTYSEIAMQEMKVYHIPASITLAQGILESGAGNGTLSKRANNHFGIKCHTGWTGDRVYHDDDEAQECFRKYVDPKTSFRDHSLFLAERSRYRFLFSLDKDDYKGWAKGLRKAGYATDPKYPDKLISLIERYDLDAYDAAVLGGAKTPVSTTSVTATRGASYTVKKGDTLYSIATKHRLTVDELKAINGLTSNNISIGQIVYLQPQ